MTKKISKNRIFVILMTVLIAVTSCGHHLVTAYAAQGGENDFPEVTFKLIAGDLVNCTITGAGVYKEGDSAVIKVHPLSGYEIFSFQVNGETVKIENDQYEISSVFGDMIFDVVCLQTVKVDIKQSDGGKITASSDKFFKGVKTDIVFTPDPGYKLTSVSVETSSGSDTSVKRIDSENAHTEALSFSQSSVVSALFEKVGPARHKVIISVSGGNAIVDPSVNMPHEVESGSEFEFNVTPADGYIVKQVTANGKDLEHDPANETRYVLKTVSADTSVVIAMAEACSVKITASEGGTFMPDINRIQKTTPIALTIIPDDGYMIKTVTVNGTPVSIIKDGREGILNAPISVDTVIDILFVKAYTITVVSTVGTETGIGGVIAAEGYELIEGKYYLVEEGTDFTVTVIPDDGYAIKETRVGNASTNVELIDNTYTFKSVNANSTIIVLFELNNDISSQLFVIEQFVGEGGWSKVIGEKKTVRGGTTITYEFVPYDYYTVDQITVDNVLVSEGIATYVFENVSSNHYIEVTFKRRTDITIPEYTDPQTQTSTTAAETSPSRVNLDIVGLADVDFNTDPIRIDISGGKKIASEVISKLKSTELSKKVIIKGSGFVWEINEARTLNLTGESELDYNVSLNSAQAKNYAGDALLDKMRESNVQGLDYCFVSVHPKTVPDGSLLKLSLEPKFAGLKLNYLSYEDGEDGKKHFVTVLQKVNNAAGEKIYERTYLEVDQSGVVEIPYFGNEHIILTRKLESRYLISVTTEKAYEEASISKGNVIIMDGTSGYRDLYWYKSGTDQLFLDIKADSDHVINRILLNGTPIEEIDEDYFSVKHNNKYLDDIGDYSGKGKIFLEIKDTTRDYALAVSFKPGTNSDYIDYPGIDAEEDNKLPLIIAIVIILVAMVFGCVMFIYKWRQERDID